MSRMLYLYFVGIASIQEYSVYLLLIREYKQCWLIRMVYSYGDSLTSVT